MTFKHLSLVSIVAFVLISLAMISVAHATSYVWAKETEHYRVYMGVVPADLVQHQPALLDEDKRLHGFRSGEKAGFSHLLVWVYRKPGNAKVLDATVIAEVGPESGDKTVKPLEKMKLSAGVSYGNFFKFHRDAKHAVTLKIFKVDGGYDEVVFEHQGY